MLFASDALTEIFVARKVTQPTTGIMNPQAFLSDEVIGGAINAEVIDFNWRGDVAVEEHEAVAVVGGDDVVALDLQR